MADRNPDHNNGQRLVQGGPRQGAGPIATKADRRRALEVWQAAQATKRDIRLAKAETETPGVKRPSNSAIDQFNARLAATPVGAPRTSGDDRAAKAAATSRVAGDNLADNTSKARVLPARSTEDLNPRLGTQVDSPTNDTPLYQSDSPTDEATPATPDERTPQHARDEPAPDRAAVDRATGAAQEANKLVNLVKNSVIGTQLGTAISATSSAQDQTDAADNAMWNILLGKPSAANELTTVTAAVTKARTAIPKESAEERQAMRIVAAMKGEKLPYFADLPTSARILDRALQRIEERLETRDLAKTIAAAFDAGTMNADDVKSWEAHLQTDEVQNLKGAINAREQEELHSKQITAAVVTESARMSSTVTKALGGGGPDLGMIGPVLGSFTGSN